MVALPTRLGGLGSPERTTSRGERGARAGAYLAWGCVTALGTFSVVAAASIGLFIVPAVLLLAAAAKLTPTSRSA